MRAQGPRPKAQGPKKVAQALLLMALVAMATPAWGQAVTPYGDLGLRYRGVFAIDGDLGKKQASGLETAFRVGVKAFEAQDLISAELSLSSGDPTSLSTPWTAFGRFGAGQVVHVDRAWLQVAASPLPALSLVAGQAPVPWRGELVWDEDVSLPGLWLDYRDKGEPGETWADTRINLGGVYLFSGSPEPEDNTFIFGAQVGATWAFDSMELSVDLGHYDLVGARRVGRAVARGDIRVGARPAGFSANTTDSDVNDPDAELTRRLVIDGFASDFKLLSLRTALTFWLGDNDDLPLQIDLHGAFNLGASGPGEGEQVALEGGLRFGRADKAGRGSVRLSGVFIGADAVLDAFNADLYGTNIVGVGLTGALVLFEGFTLSFESLASAQVTPALRGLGDARGEPLPGDPLVVQLHVTTRYDF